MSTLITSIGTYSPDNLIAGDYPLKGDEVTLESGQNLTRGALLGKVTASGEYKLSASGAGDGSETPVSVLAVDTDASASAYKAVAYFKGEFNKNAMTFGTGHTYASVKAALMQKGIILRDSIQS